MPGMNPVNVIKRNASGEEVFRYAGVVLRQEPGMIILEARFNRADLPFMETILQKGDRFIEVYYTDRWYNIYQIRDRDDDHIKGWYCNIGRPAVMEAEDLISYIDLALDLWVAPNGKQTVLDEEEFLSLPLDEETRNKSISALEELKKVFREKRYPDLG
jgi:hypothetical protein